MMGPLELADERLEVARVAPLEPGEARVAERRQAGGRRLAGDLLGGRRRSDALDALVGGDAQKQQIDAETASTRSRRGRAAPTPATPPGDFDVVRLPVNRG
jgi:hypothetical protein